MTNSDKFLDASSMTGNTGDFGTVTCNDGYASSNGFAFTVTCIATGAGTSEWNNGDLTCDGKSVSFLFETIHVGCILCVFGDLTCSDRLCWADGRK